MLQNVWNTGFTAAVQLTNNGSGSLTNWEVCWEYSDGARRTSGWNANVAGSNPYCASGVGWNDTIQQNQTIEFGVQGNKGGSDSPVAVITSCTAE